jgi:serine/threonine-protein kinase RsbW
MKTLKLKPELSKLNDLNLDEVLSFYDYRKTTILNTTLVLEELLSNIIKYSNCTSDITVQLGFSDHDIRLKVTDNGDHFNPLTAPDPDLSDDLYNRPIGKLGIYLTKQLSEEFNYNRKDGYNVVEVTMENVV